MGNKFKYIILITALTISAVGSYFSVLGLSQLFAGASLAVIIMASVLELGKVVITTALHTYWTNLSRTLKIYLTTAVGILMIITSAGIYGFLSNAYQKTANELEIHEGEISVLNAKKETFEKTISDNLKIIETKTKRVEQLNNLRTNQENRLDNSTSNRNQRNARRDIESSDKQIQNLNIEIDELNQKNIVLSDSVNTYNVKVIELNSNSKIAGEVGPLKYISELTGAPMANVVNYLILLLIFVFDPLAIALVLVTNKIFDLNGQQTPLEPKTKYEEDDYSDDDEDIDFPPPNQDLIDAKNVWARIKKMREEGKLYTPTEEDLENEPTALAFTQYDVEDDVEDEVEDEITEEVTEPQGIDAVEEITNILNEELEKIEVSEQEEVIEPEQSIEGPIEPVKEERVIRKEDIKEIKERGFSVNIPARKEKSSIQRIGSNKEIRGGNNDTLFFNKGK